MRKTNLPLFIPAILFGFMCSCVSPVEGDRFADMIGWRFETTKAGYLIHLDDDDDLFVSRADLVHGVKMLPLSVARNYVGKTSRGITILGVVPLGTTMKVTGVDESVSTIGDIVSFRCVLENGAFARRLVSLRFAQSKINGRNGGKPEIDPAFLKRVSDVGGVEKP